MNSADFGNPIVEMQVSASGRIRNGYLDAGSLA